MKPLGFTVSVLKDSNRVVASSEVDMAKVKPGDYFRLESEPTFFTVARTSKFFYIKDFEVFDRKTIKLSSEVGINLLPGDNLKLTYKEYELVTLIEIRNGGERYQVDDVLTVVGGTPSINRENGLIDSTSFTVVAVDEKGSILALGPRTKGHYLEAPETIVDLSGGAGASAVVEVHYGVVEQRATIENVVAAIPDINTGMVKLDFPLPPNLKNGKLSVEKWQLTLNGTYAGETKINSAYDISSNFTPALKLPLMLQNSFQREILFNQAMNLLEQRIVQLEARITELEKR